MKKMLHLFTKKCRNASLALALLLPAAALFSQAGGALNFDGGDDLVSISGVSLTSDFTIETWIYVQATSEAFPTVFSQGGDNLVMWLHSGSGYSLAARVGGYQVDGSGVSLNTWTHVALTRSGNTITLYQNGSQTGTASSATPSGGTFYLGYWSGFGRPFKGSIDEFRIWNTARTAAEISASMNAEIANMPNCLLAYYKFNEGTAGGNNAGITTLPDIANATSENGALSNFALSGSTSNWTTGSGITQNASTYLTNYPDINLVGNGNSIPDGTTATSSTNFTAFGNAINNLGKTRSFTIQNTGNENLTVSTITFSGTNAAEFSVSGISLPATIAPSGSSTFTVTFNPTSSGSKTATINIVNDDCDEGNYNFNLDGTGTNTFTFSSNSDWATAANWDVEVVPTTANLTSGRSVVIAQNCTMNSIGITFSSGTSLTVNSTKSLSLNTTSGITVNSGATLTIQSSGSISQGFIDNYGTMNISGSYTAFYMTNRASATLNILSGGSYSCPACAESFLVDGTINNSGTMHVGTGSTWQGTINNNAGGTITDGGNGAQIQLGANGTLNNYGSFVSRTAGMSGIFNNYSTGTLTMPPTCYFTVKNGSTFTNDGTVTLPSSNTLFDIKAGGTMVNQNTVSGIGGIAQSGTFTNSPAADINPGNSPGKLTVTGPLDLGSATYNCEINGTVQGTNYDWLAISGEATLTNASLVVNWGSYTPTAGLTFTILTCGSRTGEFASVTIPPVSGIVFSTNYSAGSVAITTSSAPVTYTFTGSGNWSSAGNWDANGVPPNPLLTGDVIVIDGSGACTMDASKTINSGATLTINAGKTLQITGAFTLTNNGTMTVSGTLNKNSGSTGLTNSATGGITIPSGGALNNNSGSFSNAGTLTTNSGGTFGNGSGNFTNSGTYNNGGSHYSTYGGFSNSGTITNTGTMTSGQYINIGNSGSWTNSSGGTMTMDAFNNSGASASLTNNGSMTIGLNNSKTFVNNATFTVNYLGQANNSGATWTNSNGATFTVGAVPFTNAGTFNNDGTMTLNQNGNTGSTFTNNGTFNCAGTLTLNSGTGSNAATKTISVSGTLNVNSAFAFTNSGTINGGGALNVTGGSLTNNGTISNLSPSVASNGTFTNASGSTWITFNGSNTNINSGTIAINSGVSATMGGQLDIFSSGTLTVNGSLTVSGFGFTNSGGIIKGSGTITPTTALNNSGFIRPGNSAGTLTFSGDLNLGSGTYTAEVDGTSAGQFDVLAVSGTATIGGSSKLHLIFSVPIVNGTTFDVLTAGTLSGSFSSGNVTFANIGGGSGGNVTAVSVSNMGNTLRLTATSLLPVELVRFTGKFIPPSGGSEGGVLLEWETASELNNEGFHVERSTDGREWLEIGFVAGNGTTTATQRYAFFDEKPLPTPFEAGRGVNYYRLRQTDFDGKEEFSPVVAIDFPSFNDLESLVLQVFPNPVTGGELNVRFQDETIKPDNFLIFDSWGRLVKNGQLLMTGSGFQIPLDGPLPDGHYFIQLKDKESRNVLTERFVVTH